MAFCLFLDCPYCICLCRISYGNASWTPSICPCPPPWGLQNSTQTLCLCIWSQWWILRHQFRQKRNSGNFDFLFSFWMWKHKILGYSLMLSELKRCRCLQVCQIKHTVESKMDTSDFKSATTILVSYYTIQK